MQSYKLNTKDKMLLVSLNDGPYFWFTDCGREFELRVYNSRWSKGQIYTGRKVKILNRYNNKKNFIGTIGKVVIGSLENILKEIDFKKIVPIANYKEEAIKIINEIFSVEKKKKYIAFEVIK